VKEGPVKQDRRERRDRERGREREGVFRIGAIAEKYGIHPQTLRMYEREGLLRPARTEGNTRLYDSDTIERLEIILTLTRHLGVNLAGVEVILHMKQRMEKMHGEVQKMLVVLREELETRRPPEADRSVALARIPGRRYALVKSER
jgi:MerR family transcriptional regulator, heat shock protein HspR